MLLVEGKYLPGVEGYDGAMTEESGRHELESGERRRAEGAATSEAGCGARIEPGHQAAFDPGCEAACKARLDPRIDRALSAIEGNPFVTIGELSRLVNLSHSRLSHLFRAAQGVSLNSFLSDRRLERAAQLLRSTEMLIKEITYDAGYKQAPSFVRAFQRRFGASPTSYRRQRMRLTNSRLD